MSRPESRPESCPEATGRPKHISQTHAPDADYVRARDLPKLVPLWPREIECVSLADHARLLAKLRHALRGERRRGIAGHWSYDIARHAQLLWAYRAETAIYLKASAARAARNRSAKINQG